MSTSRQRSGRETLSGRPPNTRVSRLYQSTEETICASPAQQSSSMRQANIRQGMLHLRCAMLRPRTHCDKGKPEAGVRWPSCPADDASDLSMRDGTPRGPESSPGLVATVEHLVVRRALVEVREHCLRFRGHVRHLVVLAHERLHRIQGVEPHQSHELHVLVPLTPEQDDGAEPRNAPRLDARDHLAPHDALIGVSVVPSGPASPEATDHGPDITHRSTPAVAPAPSVTVVGYRAHGRANLHVISRRRSGSHDAFL